MKSTINERIKLLRNHLGLTGEDFANLIDLTSTQLSRIENKKADPQNGTINKILKATNVSHEWLVFGKGELSAHVVSPETQSEVHDPYRDYALKRLEQEAENWKKKYDQVWARLEFFMDRLPLGKRNPVRETAQELELLA